MKNKIKKAIGVHQFKKKRHILLFLGIISLGIFSFSYIGENYAKNFRSEVSVKKTTEILLENPIVIDFSSPMIKKHYSGKVKIAPEEKIKEVWNEKNNQLSIYPDSLWQAGISYQLFFPEGMNIFLAKNQPFDIIFSTVAYPSVLKVSPQNGAEDVIIGIEDPILVDFSKSTFGFDAKFVLNPEAVLVYETNDDKSQFKILPKEKLKDGEKYSLEIYVKYSKQKNSDYKKIHTLVFSTQPPAPTIWEKDYALRLEQAKKFTRAKIREGKYIDVNLEVQIMSIFENGKLLDAFLISSGKKGMDTPKGEHQIYNKSPRTWSAQYGLYMPYWMAITADGKYGIHELPEWPGGYKEGANHLGVPVSHGCMRLGVGAAEKVYNFADIGTKVIIY